MKLSVVTTLYQSAPYLPDFYARATTAAQRVTPDFEIVFVNDGSSDDSLDIAVRLAETDPRVRVVDLSRNFGHHTALMTGIIHARGELVFLIDCDLEEAPELLTEFYEAMRVEEADVIYGVQRSRQGSLFERFSGAVFYTLFNLLAQHKIPRNLVTVRLMSRRYVDALAAHQERELFIAGLWSIVGFRQVSLPMDKQDNGTTTYTLRLKLSTLLNAITSFSSAPLRFVFYLGTLVMIVSGACGFYLVIHALFFGRYLAGWASLMVSIWLLGGMMIFCVGVVGIYVSKVFSETKQRPYTIVRHVYETGTAAPPPPAPLSDSAITPGLPQ